jgi:K+-sensing histidine kinase KdpD
MKKYLKEIETSGMIMLFLGAILGHAVNMNAGAIAAAIGLLLWVVIIIYKALHWELYRRDNLLNIFVMLGAILTIFILFFLKR